MKKASKANQKKKEEGFKTSQKTSMKEMAGVQEKQKEILKKAQAEAKEINKRKPLVSPNEPTAVTHDLPMDDDGFENVSSTIFKFEEAGQQLMGVLDGFGDITLETGVCRAYFLITETMGRISFIGGFVIDKIIEEQKINNGDLLKITYLGKGSTAKGHRINMFDVRVKRYTS